MRRASDGIPCLRVGPGMEVDAIDDQRGLVARLAVLLVAVVLDASLGGDEVADLEIALDVVAPNCTTYAALDNSLDFLIMSFAIAIIWGPELLSKIVIS